jgi:flavin reductase (DIM6/NTAB) family NADH-FMN oxidoreductase RutF
VDKFHAFQIAAQPGSHVHAPVLADAFAAYECRLVGRHTYGDHDVFMGEVVAVQWDASAFTSDGLLDVERVQPIVYLGEDRYATAAEAVLLDRKALMRSALDTRP